MDLQRFADTLAALDDVRNWSAPQGNWRIGGSRWIAYRFESQGASQLNLTLPRFFVSKAYCRKEVRIPTSLG
jgi:hypothetical protein